MTTRAMEGHKGLDIERLATVVTGVAGALAVVWRWGRPAVLWFYRAIRARVMMAENVVALQASIDELRTQTSVSEGISAILLDRAGVALWVSAPDGHCLWASQPLADLMGCEVDEILGFNWVNAIPQELRAGVEKAWLEAVERGERFRFEYAYKHADGTIVPVVGQATPVPDVAGKVVRFLGHVKQI